MFGDGLGCEPVRQCPHVVDADDVRGQPVQVIGHQTFVEQRVHDREQQRGIRSGPGRQVAIGEFGRPGAGRVDDHQASAALAQRFELAAEVRDGRETSVGHQRVRADDDEEVGAVDVWHGECDRVAEHQPERDVLRHLIEGARREGLVRAETLDDER